MSRGFNGAVALLRERCPTPLPVVVRRVTQRDSVGSCSLQRRRFVITIDPGLVERHPSAAIWIIAHEWAHALSWHLGERDHHGPGFGRAYARVARIISRF